MSIRADSGQTVTYTGWLTLVDCGECHVTFGIDADWQKSLKRSGALFYCPNGHHIAYSQTENQRLNEEKVTLERRLASATARAQAWQDQARAAERTAIAHKGHATRLRKRAAAGVCPCCQRSFQNVARHMASQHPAFGADSTT